MIALVGLGNPGVDYKYTRHNIGFVVIDELREALQVSQETQKFSALMSSGNYKGETLLFAKPQTFMNLSGDSVCQIKKFYKLQNEQIFVFHDDIDLEFGKIKIKIGGGAAGHNGLKSLDKMIGNEYVRIRIGVGKPQFKGEVHNYVLNNFEEAEMEILRKKMKNICTNLDFLLAKQFSILLQTIE